MVGLPVLGGVVVHVVGRIISVAPPGDFDNLLFAGLGMVVGVVMALWIVIHR